MVLVKQFICSKKRLVWATWNYFIGTMITSSILTFKRLTKVCLKDLNLEETWIQVLQDLMEQLNRYLNSRWLLNNREISLQACHCLVSTEDLKHVFVRGGHRAIAFCFGLWMRKANKRWRSTKIIIIFEVHLVWLVFIAKSLE